MTVPAARLAFFKLTAPDLAAAQAFWSRAFGFAEIGRYDLPDFAEAIMAIPGQEESGPQLMLLQPKPAAAITIGSGHGPVGLVCADIAASHAHALREGATELMAPADVGGVIVSLLAAPQGHQIELVQLP